MHRPTHRTRLLASREERVTDLSLQIEARGEVITEAQAELDQLLAAQAKERQALAEAAREAAAAARTAAVQEAAQTFLANPLANDRAFVDLVFAEVRRQSSSAWLRSLPRTNQQQVSQ